MMCYYLNVYFQGQRVKVSYLSPCIRELPTAIQRCRETYNSCLHNIILQTFHAGESLSRGVTFIDRATPLQGVGRTNSRVGREKQGRFLMNSRWVIHRLLRLIHVQQCVLNGVRRGDNGGFARKFQYCTKIIIRNLPLWMSLQITFIFYLTIYLNYCVTRLHNHTTKSSFFFLAKHVAAFTTAACTGNANSLWH
jgi:hypothetical protein